MIMATVSMKVWYAIMWITVKTGVMRMTQNALHAVSDSINNPEFSKYLKDVLIFCFVLINLHIKGN